MAAEDEGRTEEASEYRIEKERKEGRVAKSQEISSALVMLLCVMFLVFLGKWIFNECINILTYYFNRTSNPDITDNNLKTAFFVNYLKIVVPISLVGIVGAFFGNIIQTKGFLFSWKPLTPDFKRIVPNFGEYFKRTVFSGKGLFNIAKSIGKVIIIIVVAFLLIKKDLFVLIDIIDNGQIVKAIGKIASMASQLLLFVAVIFLALSIPDYFVQRKDFLERLKMTKQEVKEEYKEMEGDPQVKGRLKAMQQQLLSQNIREIVSQADVVITNPTHFAVSLKYEQGVDDAPKVTAKGEDEVALYMRRVAAENNVPVVENRPVARVLYTELRVGDIIPEKYYRAVTLIYSKILPSED